LKDAELDRRQQAIVNRSEVRQAIDKVGRILDLPFFPIYWGDY